MTSTNNEYASRLAQMQERESKALSAVTTAAAALARKQKKNDATRTRLAGEEQTALEDLEAAQAAYVDEAGAERASAVLGITPAAARALLKTKAPSPGPEPVTGSETGAGLHP